MTLCLVISPPYIAPIYRPHTLFPSIFPPLLSASSASKAEPGALRYPTDCMLDERRGLLYVCDRGHARVQVFSCADGAFVGAFGQVGVRV
jgi:hypothetical protein